MPNNEPPVLTLVRSLTIHGPDYETTIEVREVAVASTYRALTITQPRGSGEDDDVVVLVWAEWAELRDYVDSWWGTMPEPPGPDRCGFKIDGTTSDEAGRCVLNVGHPLINGNWHIAGDGELLQAEPPF